MSDETLENRLAQRVAALGFEFVELEMAGSRARPVLRVRIDRPGSVAGQGVTVEDCSRASRVLEEMLDADAEMSDRYVLEVSSPGVERPLVRRVDFDRFAGREVALRGHTVLAGRSRRLEGKLIGVGDVDGRECVRIRTDDGEEFDVPRAEIARAHLVFRWGQP